jgi:hypothetical protein
MRLGQGCAAVREALPHPQAGGQRLDDVGQRVGVLADQGEDLR